MRPKVDVPFIRGEVSLADKGSRLRATAPGREREKKEKIKVGRGVVLPARRFEKRWEPVSQKCYLEEPRLYNHVRQNGNEIGKMTLGKKKPRRRSAGGVVWRTKQTNPNL